MKGSHVVGAAMILAGILIVYAGWKNEPILSVIGLKSSAQNTGVPPIGSVRLQPTPTPIPTPGGHTRTYAQ